MSMNQEIVDFIMELLGDSDKAQQFNDNPGKCIAESGLHDVTANEVVEAMPKVIEQVSPGGGWTPPVTSGGTPSEIIHQVVNNYYTTVIGDNNTVVQANGPGAVAVGGDNNGNISTGGGVTGDGNEVGNTTTNETTSQDNSVHGNNSGNSTKTGNLDNSTNDNHGAVNATDQSRPTQTEQSGLHPGAATMPPGALTPTVTPTTPATAPLSATTPMSASTPLDAAVLTTTVAATQSDTSLTDSGSSPFTSTPSTGSPFISSSPFDDAPGDIPTVPQDNSSTTSGTDHTTSGPTDPDDPTTTGTEHTTTGETDPLHTGTDPTHTDFGDDGTVTLNDPIDHDTTTSVIDHTAVDTSTTGGDTYSPQVVETEQHGIVAPESGHIPDGVYY